MKRLAAIVVFLLCAPLFAHAAGPIYLSEIAWAGSTASLADEWLEVCGPPETDLSNWMIEGASAHVITLPADSAIPSSGAFLIANYGADDAKTTLAVAPNLVTTAVSLSNSALFVTLRDAHGTIIDVAGASGTAPLAGTSGDQKASMERLLPLVDGGTPAAWRTALSSSGFDLGTADLGTPGACPIAASATGTEPLIDTTVAAPAPIEETITIAAPPLAPTTAVRISEAYPAPLSGEKEWIELTNPSGTGELLDGWTIEDGKGTATTLAGTVLPWSRFVIVAPKGTLNNDGDLIVLKDPSGRVIDGVAYGNWDTALYPRTGEVGRGEALMRFELQDTFDVTTVPTPNAANVLIKKIDGAFSTGRAEAQKMRDPIPPVILSAAKEALPVSSPLAFVTATQENKKSGPVATETPGAKSVLKKTDRTVTKKPVATRYKGEAYLAEVAVPPGVYSKTRMYVLRAGVVQELRLSKSSSVVRTVGERIAFVAQAKNEAGEAYLLANPNSMSRVGSASTTFAAVDAWPEAAGAYRFRAEVVAARSDVLEVRLHQREGDVLLPTALAALKPGDVVTIEGFVSPGARPRVVLPSATALTMEKSIEPERNPHDPRTAMRLPWPATMGLTVAAVIAGILVYLRSERLKRLQLVMQPIEEDAP